MGRQAYATQPAEFIFLELVFKPTPVARFARTQADHLSVTIAVDVLEVPFVQVLQVAERLHPFIVSFAYPSQGICKMRLASLGEAVGHERPA